jgi:hypothetical protein
MVLNILRPGSIYLTARNHTTQPSTVDFALPLTEELGSSALASHDDHANISWLVPKDVRNVLY